ncbi:hypothetical protein CHARACLAT_028699 [Characodon lateralis]|uniref:Uncharacterized protein n=1 Tax=Characodon lateralis TaxID=208331 RepID=A0ABU7EQR1_9TELE|nr:hypothetical protein [Characodon lateralis]
MAVVGVSARRCNCGSWYALAGCFGVCWLTPGGCLPGPGPLGSVGPLLGERYVPGSLAPWLDLLGRIWLQAGPVGLLLQLSGASALWLLGVFLRHSPALLWGGAVAVVPGVVLL